MARTRRTPVAPPKRLILDSGAVIALSRSDQRARAVLTAAWEAGVDVDVPAVVLAETLRGGPADARVHRALKAVGEAVPTSDATGRTAGSLLGAARSTSTVDAIVVATALVLGGGVVLTGDPDDLSALAAGHPEVVVQSL